MTNDYSLVQSVSSENEERVVGQDIVWMQNQETWEGLREREIGDEAEDFTQFKSHSSWLSSKSPPCDAIKFMFFVILGS